MTAVNIVLLSNEVPRSCPFHLTFDPGTNPVPVTVSLNPTLPFSFVSGLSLVTVGDGLVAGVIVMYFGADTLPPGFTTVTVADGPAAMSDARIAALICVTPRNVVALSWPFHCTTDPDMKFDPLRVRSKAGPPATTCCGCKLEITGWTAPSCITVNGCPPIINVPIRPLIVGFAATE
jgi:hypothetical protein